MSPNRRDFLWTMGSAAALLAIQQSDGIYWAAPDEPQLGWAPGLEEQLSSSCLICPSRCGVRARTVDGKLVRLMGNTDHPMSQGGLCPRGVAGPQMLYHPERLRSALVRDGARGEGRWRAVSHEEAIAQVGERLQALRNDQRPEALAVHTGYCAGSMNDVWRRFAQAYGSPNLIADDYSDGTDAVMGLMHGIRQRPGYDLENATLVMSFGAPLFESWWSPLQAYVASSKLNEEGGRRGRFIHVDTRFSRTAAFATDWIGIRPGTYGTLALGLAYVILRDRLHDADFVAEHVSGFENFSDDQGRPREGYRSLVMRGYRTEEVSAITGVPVDRITAMARTFANNDQAVAVCGPDVTMAPNGLLAALAVHSLNVLVGNINRRGGVLFRDDVPIAPLATPVLDPVSRAGFAREPVAGAQGPFSAADRGDAFAAAVADGADADVEALLLYEVDPLTTSARPGVWEQALAKIPFVVSFSPFLDRTSRQADVVLPDLLPYERWQDAPTPESYPYPTWGIARPLVEPHEGGMHTGDVVLALASYLGGGVSQSLPYADFESLLRGRAQGLFESSRGMAFAGEIERESHRQMEERGWWLPVADSFQSFWTQLVERGGWSDPFHDFTDPGRIARTPSRRIELLPAELDRALQAEGTGRQAYMNVTDDSATVGEGFPLRLIPYRISTLASSTLGLEPWLAEQPGVFPDVQWVPWVSIAPSTAEELSLHEDAPVWVVSERSRYRARLKVSPGCAPETVCAPFGLQHPDGELANPLALLSDEADPLTGVRSWHTTLVRLEAAEIGSIV